MRLGMSNGFAKTFHLSAILSYLGSRSNRFTTSINLFQSNIQSLIPKQLTLEKSQVFRVPSACRELHVLSGIAWMTLAGEDLILKAGEKAFFTSDKGSAILSTLGNVPLILEIF